MKQVTDLRNMDALHQRLAARRGHSYDNANETAFSYTGSKSRPRRSVLVKSPSRNQRVGHQILPDAVVFIWASERIVATWKSFNNGFRYVDQILRRSEERRV